MKLALLQNSSIKKAPLRTLLSLSLAAAVLALALGFFLYNLQYQSISPNSDEVIHIRVTQEMFHSGMWWLPTHGGGPYFNKPPLKMWLSLLPLRIFGENNLSYRFVDICAGVGLLLATMVLGAKLYRSSLVGPIAALLLLACKPLVIGAHGIRSGTQDALLLFLLALAALCLWRIIAKANSGAVSFWALVMLGVLSGLAILVKSAAGVLPLLVAGPWLLARRETRGFRQLLAVGVPALLLPALYLLPHCLFTAGACRRFFVSEVLHRVTEGFHNRSDWSYYLRAIFRDGVIGTGLLASLAVGYALYRSIRHRDQRAAYLLTWLAVPLLVFSVSKTRLQWYIFPAYPALALLIAALFVAVGQKISEYHEKKKPIFAVSGILLITFFSYVLAGDTYKSLESLFSGLQQIPQQQIPLDKLVSSVLRSGVTLYGPTQDTRANPTRGRFNVEGIYWRSLKTHYQETAVTELQAKAASGEVRDFVAPFATPYVESGIASAQSYLLLPQFKTRREMLIAFSSGNDFTAIEQYVPAHLLKPFFGLGEMRDIGPRNVRFFQKPRAALQVQADELLARYPSRWNLRVGWSGTGKVKTVIVHVQVNERQLATLTLKKKSVTDYHFETPAGVLLPGENVLLLTVRDANGQLVDASAEQIYIEHLVSNLR